jgi:hypothetical protein
VGLQLSAPLSFLQICPQEILAIRNKAGDLHSRVGALEEFFDSRPSDREDQERRFNVIEYARSSPVALSVDFIPASSRTSKDDCALVHNLLILQKTPERLPGSSKS